MTTTTYYNLNIVEGTDIVNPLTVDNPNYEKIDETLHNNAVAGVTLATEIANATVHAITRENSDCAVIRFIATSRWKAGDTATVDGVPVTALLPSGETLPDGAYVINANVLCILTGTNLTFYLEGNKVENASDIIYNDTNVGAELDKLNGSVEQLNGSVEQINSNLKWLSLGNNATSYTIPQGKKEAIVNVNSNYGKLIGQRYLSDLSVNFSSYLSFWYASDNYLVANIDYNASTRVISVTSAENQGSILGNAEVLAR